MNQGQTAFAGSAYDPRLGEDWVSGQITLDGYRLRFVSQSASFEIPLVRLQIEVDKTDGTQVLFRDATAPETWHATHRVALGAAD